LPIIESSSHCNSGVLTFIRIVSHMSGYLLRSASTETFWIVNKSALGISSTSSTGGFHAAADKNSSF